MYWAQKNTINLLAIGCLFLVVNGTSVSACTILTLVFGDQVLMGNNEDFTKRGAVWFVPASEGKLGRINFGFHDWKGKRENFAQGSMNEKGLAFDAAVVQKVLWQADPEKPTPKNLIELIMDTCSTVDQAIELFGKNNCQYLAVSQFMFADATGASAVITWDADGLSVTRKPSNHQVVTNTRLSIPTYRCVRWTKANQIIAGAETSGKTGLEIVREALESVHQHGQGFTSYSCVYDLKKRRVHIYNLTNFEEVVEFDLLNELEKGATEHLLKDLFQLSPTLKTVKSKEQRVDYGTRQSLPVASLTRLAGIYETDTTPVATVQIAVHENGLKVVKEGQPDELLFPESEQMFRLNPDRGQVSFQFDANNRVVSLTLHKQIDVVAKRISD